MACDFCERVGSEIRAWRRLAAVYAAFTWVSITAIGKDRHEEDEVGHWEYDLHGLFASVKTAIYKRAERWSGGGQNPTGRRPKSKKLRVECTTTNKGHQTVTSTCKTTTKEAWATPFGLNKGAVSGFLISSINMYYLLKNPTELR